MNIDRVNGANLNILQPDKKLGRKPKPVAERKTERICIYMTKDQKEAIESLARQEFMAVGDYLLKKALQ